MSKQLFKIKEFAYNSSIIRKIYLFLYRNINKNIAMKQHLIMNVINIQNVSRFSFNTATIERAVMITSTKTNIPLLITIPNIKTGPSVANTKAYLNNTELSKQWGWTRRLKVGEVVCGSNCDCFQ